MEYKRWIQDDNLTSGSLQTGAVNLSPSPVIAADGGDEYLSSGVEFQIAEESGGQFFFQQEVLLSGAKML